MSDLKALAETMKSFSDTAGDHHWQAGEALEQMADEIKLLKKHLSLLAESLGAVIMNMGIMSNDQNLTGPQLLLLGDDAAKFAIEQHAQIRRLREYVADLGRHCGMDSLPEMSVRGDLLLAETPEQSVAHIEAAALRKYVDKQIVARRLEDARPYALLYGTAKFCELCAEADRIESAAKS